MRGCCGGLIEGGGGGGGGAFFLCGQTLRGKRGSERVRMRGGMGRGCGDVGSRSAYAVIARSLKKGRE